jgi:hypothetical protein
VSVAGEGSLTARFMATDGETVTFTRDDGKGPYDVVHPLSALGKGAVQVEFARPGAAVDEDLDEDLDDESDSDDDHDHEADDPHHADHDEHDLSAEEARA